MNTDKHIIISLGGSLIVPEGIDGVFIKSFVDLIKEFVSKGYKFAIITGGGHTARNYINTLKEIAHPTPENLDWVGIAVTRLNAELIRTLFGTVSHDSIIINPDDITNTNNPILIGAGWKPGNSSDLAAIHTAKSLHANVVINLSNIDYVYDKDPKQFPDAVKIEKSSWADFRKILPENWSAGLSAPFDPIAAREAESANLEVIIMNGKNLENLRNYFDGKEFIGTIIK